MDFLKKNKIIVGIVVVVLLVVGVWFFALRKSGNSTTAPIGSGEAQIKQIKPEDIGLLLSLSSDKKSVTMIISKLAGIKTIEYEMSYDAEESSDEGIADVPKGVVGSPIDIKGESEIKRVITLGTCSASKCRYDIVKSDIEFIVKVTYTNGEIGSATASIPLGE